MNRIIINVTNKVKSCLAFPGHLLSYLRRTVNEPKFEKNGKYAIINMDRQFREDDYSRHLYILCMHMQNAGFKPIVRMEWRDIKNIDGYGFRKFLWRENYVFVRHCHTTVNTILLRQSGKRDHVIEIPYGYNIPASKHIDCIAPFPMDPTQNVNYSAIVEQLPTIRRTVKVLFSGKTTGKLYGKERLKMFFNHISRPEVIHFIFSRFPNRVRSLKTTEDTVIFRQLLDSTDYSNQIIISEVKTDPKDWFNILAKADFFLSAPGARMPWCHNTVEAMAVGTIPIIQYGDLYDPPLEHMKTCIRYNSLEELQTVIEQVLNMEQIEIDKLRRNVREYYNDYLSTDSITKKINSFFSSNKEKLTVAVPFIPTRAEAIAIPAHQL